MGVSWFKVVSYFPHDVRTQRESALRRSFLTFSNPWLVFLVWLALCFLLFYRTLEALVRYSIAHDDASHILLIPLIVTWLFYTERAKLSRSIGVALDIFPATLFGLAASLLLILNLRQAVPQPDVSLSLRAASLVLVLISGFVAVFGRKSAGKVWFSLAFLGFAIPLPEWLLNGCIYVLQYASAAVAGLIFDWSGLPVLREGLVFRLSGFNIEVAKECSGIRSSIALVILAVLVAHFALTKLWKKVLFVMAGLVVMAVKNGVRMATLTILATSVDLSFLSGKLHHQGGVVFFLFGLALLAPVYWLLRRGETANSKSDNPAAMT